MRRCFSIFALLLAASAHAQGALVNPTPDWVLAATGAGDAAVTGLASRADGFASPRLAVACGVFEGELSFGGDVPPLTAPADSPAAFVLALDMDAPEGRVVWQRRMACTDGCPVAATAVAMADRADPSEVDVVVVGWAEGPVTIDGGGAPDITLGHDGGADGFVARYDATGLLLWAERNGGPGDVRPQGVATYRPDGIAHLLVAGAFTGDATWASEAGSGGSTSAGGTDGFLVAYTPDGVLEHVLQVGGSQDDALVDVDIFFDVWAAGTVRDTVVFGADTLVSRGGADAIALRLSPTLAVEEVVQAGGPEDDEAVAIHARDYFDPPWLSGTFAGTLAVGETAITSAGGTDGFHIQLTSPWHPPPHYARAFGSTADDIVSDMAATVSFFGDVFAPHPIAVGTTLGRLQVEDWDGPILLPSFGGADGFTFGTSGWYPDTGAQVGGPGEDHVLAATVSGYHGGGLLLGGSFQQSGRFGTLVLPGHGAGDDDAFIASYPEGALTFFIADAEQAPAPERALTVAPNPSRGASTVRLMLGAQAAHVTVRVHDALGRIVAVLHDGPLGAGEASFALPPGLAPGRYLVRASGGATGSIALTVVR